MTQILPNIYAVAADAKGVAFKISETNYLCSLLGIENRTWQAIPPRLGETGFEKFELIGCITPSEVDFDPEGIVEKRKFGRPIPGIVYRNYMQNPCKIGFATAAESLLEKLNDKAI
jgi:hypothetical protein